MLVLFLAEIEQVMCIPYYFASGNCLNTNVFGCGPYALGHWFAMACLKLSCELCDGA